MKVGVLSDTHIDSFEAGLNLSERLMQGPFADVDAILHAGDMILPELASCFSPIPWYAVRGNMDGANSGNPIKRIVEMNNKRIGMIHGWGAQTDLKDRVLNSFAEESLDVLVFGHSHQPLCLNYGSLLLFNPGSPTDRRKASCHTVGILTLGAEITGTIIPLD